uniref:Uncharacterized protein n=1 Tax=Compsopogon caeruleus TaxID=31354 RepID=A0A7S1THD6_9RHOD
MEPLDLTPVLSRRLARWHDLVPVVTRLKQGNRNLPRVHLRHGEYGEWKHLESAVVAMEETKGRLAKVVTDYVALEVVSGQQTPVDLRALGPVFWHPLVALLVVSAFAMFLIVAISWMPSWRFLGVIPE